MEENIMDKITTEMAEYVCDLVCGKIDDVSNDEADRICDECRMGQFMCDILNEYNRVVRNVK